MMERLEEEPRLESRSEDFKAMMGSTPFQDFMREVSVQIEACRDQLETAPDASTDGRETYRDVQMRLKGLRYVEELPEVILETLKEKEGVKEDED